MLNLYNNTIVNLETARKLKTLGYSIPTRSCYLWYGYDNNNKNHIWKLFEDAINSFKNEDDFYFKGISYTDGSVNEIDILSDWINSYLYYLEEKNENLNFINWNINVPKNRINDDLSLFLEYNKIKNFDKDNFKKEIVLTYITAEKAEEIDLDEFNKICFNIISKFPEYKQYYFEDCEETDVDWFNVYPETISAPTILEVLFWLKDKYFLDINITTEDGFNYTSQVVGWLSISSSVISQDWITCAKLTIDQVLTILELEK